MTRTTTTSTPRRGLDVAWWWTGDEQDRRHPALRDRGR